RGGGAGVGRGCRRQEATPQAGRQGRAAGAGEGSRGTPPQASGQVGAAEVADGDGAVRAVGAEEGAQVRGGVVGVEQQHVAAGGDGDGQRQQRLVSQAAGQPDDAPGRGVV